MNRIEYYKSQMDNILKIYEREFVDYTGDIYRILYNSKEDI